MVMFGKSLRKIRKEKRFSQQELAKRLGYKSNSYIADTEKGEFIPSEERLKKIAKALGHPLFPNKRHLNRVKVEGSWDKRK